MKQGAINVGMHVAEPMIQFVVDSDVYVSTQSSKRRAMHASHSCLSPSISTLRSELELIDGALALGYLFSIQQAPLDADWNNSWFAMLLFFSMCLFLAFIRDHRDLKFCAAGVPVMASVMYLPIEVRSQIDSSISRQIFMFGSSRPAAPSHQSQDLSFTRNRNVATIWRRERILADTLERLDPTKKLPILSDISLQKLSVHLNNVIMGKKSRTSSKEQPLLGEQWESVKTQLVKQLGDQCSFVVVPRGLIRNPRTKHAIEPLFYKVINMLFAGSQADQEDIVRAFKDLLCYYITPKVYRKDSDGVPRTTPEPLKDHHLEQVSTKLEQLWEDHGVLALEKLRILRTTHDVEGGYDI